MAETKDLKMFLDIMDKDIDDGSMKILKQLCCFLPVRSKGQNFIKFCMGLYETTYRNQLVSKESMDKIFKYYTSSPNWFCTKVNILLGLDTNFEKKDKDTGLIYGDYIKQLKCCIGWQGKTKNFSGIVYRGAFLSPIEIYAYRFKDTFYIPSFVSTSIDINVATKSPFKGNVLIKIDISKENKFSTIIQNDQTIYPDEKECLLSCYNIYHFKNVYYDKSKDYVVMELETVSYDNTNNLKDHTIIGATHGDFPLKFLKSGSDFIKKRDLPAKELWKVVEEIIKCK